MKKKTNPHTTPDDRQLAMDCGISVKRLRADRKAEDLPEHPRTGRHYKVWVEIEELDAKGDTKADCAQLGILPDCVGSFEGKNAKAEAISRMANIVNAFGSPLTIETSDAIPRRDKV